MEYFFEDKNKREIFIDFDYDDTFTAYHEGRKIGVMIFSTSEYPIGYTSTIVTAMPNYAEVDEPYRNSGIGTEMIKYAKEVFEEVSFYPNTGNREEIHYTDEGIRLKESCEAKGITKANEM